MHGTKHCNDFEDACSKLEDYVTSLAEQIQLQKDVGDRLIQSQVYYEHQYGEAKIVANVSTIILTTPLEFLVSTSRPTLMSVDSRVHFYSLRLRTRCFFTFSIFASFLLSC